MTFDTLYPLTENEAQELAAALLTASTIERYERGLRASTAVPRLQALFYNSPAYGTEFLRYAWSLWSRLLETPQRSEWELPLAALMCVLANSGMPDAGKLLTACSVSQKPQASWLSGLARQLLRDRSDSVVFEAYTSHGFEAIVQIPRNLSGSSPYTILPSTAEERNPASGDTREVNTMRRVA